MSANLNECVTGRTVERVDGSQLFFEDGASIQFRLTGDCCSSSEWTKEEQFKELVGAKILSAENRSGRSDTGVAEPENHDVLSWHFLVFTTDKGHVTIDWHNDSNGYYDGDLLWEMRTPAESSSL